MAQSVLLIITGSIAAYKSLEVIRRLRERGVEVNCILTRGGAEFITPLSVSSLSGRPVYSELFSLKDETEMGHIRLSRESDLVVVAPASANIIAKMATGMADDLATAALLATDKPVLVAPAMNTKMWEHKATQRNIRQIKQDGVAIIEPSAGDLACGEVGQGRLAEPDAIVEVILQRLKKNGPLKGLKALVTSGPTFEPIDPVRFLGNRSSGKQGIAIAQALADAGAEVTLVTGPTHEANPTNMEIMPVETTQEMLDACMHVLPVDIAVCAAAVSDWRMKDAQPRKLKKGGKHAPELELVENPDILKYLSGFGRKRPTLVIGFAAETENVVKNAQAKLKAKGCDWIVANDVSGNKVFGRDDTGAHFITATAKESWANISKQELAARLTAKIIERFRGKPERIRA